MFLAITLTVTATGLGILIGCAFNDLEVALNFTPLVFFSMLLFSGFYVNNESILEVLKVLEYLSPIRYTLEGLVYTEFEGSDFVPNPIDSLGFDFGYWKCAIILWIYGVVVRIIGFIVLLINVRLA